MTCCNLYYVLNLVNVSYSILADVKCFCVIIRKLYVYGCRACASTGHVPVCSDYVKTLCFVCQKFAELCGFRRLQTRARRLSVISGRQCCQNMVIEQAWARVERSLFDWARGSSMHEEYQMFPHDELMVTVKTWVLSLRYRVSGNIHCNYVPLDG